MKKAQVSKYLALNKLNREDKLRLARREITIDQGYALATKGKLSFDYKPKPTPCPYCGEFHEDYPLFRVSLCGTCEARLKEAIKRERRFKQAKRKKFMKDSST